MGICAYRQRFRRRYGQLPSSQGLTKPRAFASLGGMARSGPPLHVLDARIQARCDAIREAHPAWPCGPGCDACCRALPHLPRISEPEWARLRAAIAAMPDEARARVEARVREAPPTGPLTCPLLDRDAGACLVYGARPLACRTYGFYTERDAGLHCAKVTRFAEERAAEGAPVVWGNGEAHAADADAHGEPRSLADWWLV